MALPNLHYILLTSVIVLNLASVAYIVLAIRRVAGFRPQRNPTAAFRPAVTVLKPICGLDVDLYKNLQSFCLQDYPTYQVIFGVRDAGDPAITIARQLIAERPDCDLSLVIDPQVTGPNLKVSNLHNMSAAAKHAHLVIADSDMRVDAGYLATIIAPFDDPQVGAVTCLYSGTPRGGLPSVLASMFINEWFLPSVLVSNGLRNIRFGLGATVVVRRDLLEQIGGFSGLAHYLADDHMIGKLISDLGYRVVLSGYVVENRVYESSLSAMLRHELRWARTVRAVEPLGHAFSFFMYGIPLAMIASVMLASQLQMYTLAVAITAIAVILRCLLHVRVHRKLDLPTDGRAIWLVPVRDTLSFLVWGASFFSRKIEWKNMTFTVDPNGLMTATKGYES